jgi:uncharacterized protein YcbX
VLSVAAINIAPVKALGLVHPDRVRLERDGVAEDRRLFLVREDGSVATLRTHPQLTAVVPDLDLTNCTLALTLPDGSVTRSPLEPVGAAVEVDLFGKTRTGRAVPGDLADVLSEVAGEPLRLVLADRVGVGWDEGPVSLLARASVEQVATPGPGDRASRRYRMLLDVAGAAPFEEDSWVGRRIEVGDVVLAVTHALGRCLVINHDPDDGARNWAGLHAVAAHRPDVTLGVIAEVDRPGVVGVGDALTLA